MKTKNRINIWFLRTVGFKSKVNGNPSRPKLSRTHHPDPSHPTVKRPHMVLVILPNGKVVRRPQPAARTATYLSIH